MQLIIFDKFNNLLTYLLTKK